jgi:hypothetical protein
MNRFVRFIEALHESRQHEAARVVSRHQRLIEEARDYERHRASAITQARAAEAAPCPGMHLAARSAS